MELKDQIREQVKDQLKEMIRQLCQSIGVTPEIIPEDDFIINKQGPLGFDSLDAIELTMMVEKKFGIKFNGVGEVKKVFRSLNLLTDYIVQHSPKLASPSAQLPKENPSRIGQ